MTGLRAALRIARRDALRAKGRSALVVAMIGLPMLALAFVDVTVRTAEVPPAERARRELGAADLLAVSVSREPIVQSGPYAFAPADAEKRNSDGGGPPERQPDLAPLLPPGSRVVPRHTFYLALFEANDRTKPGLIEQVDLADPMAAGLVRVRSGSVPAAAGDAALTPHLASLLGVGVGDTVHIRGGGDLRVTGLVVRPDGVHDDAVYVSPATRVPRAGDGDTLERRWAVDLPPGVSDLDVVPALNRRGIQVTPRTWVLDPPPDPYDQGMDVDATGVGVVVVVVGLAALEVMLLAGTAFAVGARRRRRELGLLAATGGDRRHVRRVVLAGGAVLGAAAGLVGVAGGVVAVVVFRPLLESASGRLFGPLDVRPLEVGAVVALGTGTALLAALLPARAAARQPVLAALTGRRGDAAVRKRFPILALVAIVAGAALAFWAAGETHRVDPNRGVFDAGRRANYPLVLLGSVVAELGFVAIAPALVALVGTFAGRFPLSLRLAARDAARHRARSGPAVAAVVAAVAGSVAVSVYLASDTERQRRDYEPAHTVGSVRLGRHAPGGTVPDSDVAAALAALPVRARIDTFDVTEACVARQSCANWRVELPREHECPSDIECTRRMPIFGPIAVGPPELVEWALGRPDERAERALREGRVVVLDERWIVDGKVVVVRETFDDDQPVVSRRVAIPAVAVGERVDPRREAAVTMLTPETARRYGLPTTPGATLVQTTRMPTEREEAQARAALGRTVPWPDMYVERGFRTDADVVLLVLALAAGLVTLAATGVATGLAAADSRPDLATFAAIGAAPRIRRRLVMAQAATVAVLGSGLGLLAGLVPAIAVVTARAGYPLVLPWGTFGVSAVAVPVFAALLVGLCTRSRLPLERRVA